MRIGVNCGHTVSGTVGSGAVGFINESVETREVGERLITLLKDAGHTVINCTDDYAETTAANLSAICNMANRQPLDLFVSIHFNSGGGKGAEVFTYGGQRHAEAVAICDKLHALGFVNRGVKDGSNLYVLKKTDAKSMLVEVCFVDSQADVELYHKLGAGIIATAIAEAITGQEKKRESEDLTMGQYKELKEAIDGLKPMIYDYVDENMPDWARPTIQKLKDKGILKGDENGRLGLTTDALRILVVLDRTGIFG